MFGWAIVICAPSSPSWIYFFKKSKKWLIAKLTRNKPPRSVCVSKARCHSRLYSPPKVAFNQLTEELNGALWDEQKVCESHDHWHTFATSANLMVTVNYFVVTSFLRRSSHIIVESIFLDFWKIFAKLRVVCVASVVVWRRNAVSRDQIQQGCHASNERDRKTSGKTGGDRTCRLFCQRLTSILNGTIFTKGAKIKTGMLTCWR